MYYRRRRYIRIHIGSHECLICKYLAGPGADDRLKMIIEAVQIYYLVYDQQLLLIITGNACILSFTDVNFIIVFF